MIDRDDGHHLEPEDLAMMVSRGDGMTFKERQRAAELIRKSGLAGLGADQLNDMIRRMDKTAEHLATEELYGFADECRSVRNFLVELRDVRLAGPGGLQNAAPQEPSGKSPGTAGNSGYEQKAPRGAPVRDVPADAAPSVGPWKECVYVHPDAPISEPSIAQILEVIRHNESVDDHGDCVGAQPESQWETGYAAGVRCIYRLLKKARQGATTGGNK